MTDDFSLECPCCGNTGANPMPGGYYYDGQPLVCGCKGQVSGDAETEAFIDASDCDCYERESA